MPRGRPLLFLAAALVGGLLLVPARAAEAQAVSTCGQVTETIDLNADGQPEAMALACQFTPGADDRLTIYKHSGSLMPDVPWRQNVAGEDETWVLDHGARGRASLIVRFRKDGGALAAELYDDRDQDGEVGYRLEGGRVVITEGDHWTVRVVAPDGWWTRGGALNYNLHIEVDGDVEAMFMVEPYRSGLTTDGQPDFDIRIYDENHNGRPEYDRRMILTRALQGSVGLGTQMMANWADDELPISGGLDLWPYLDPAHRNAGGGRVVKGYESTPAPLKFEPDSGRIEAVGEFVASRGGEHNCFYYSANPWLARQVNESDFESPFCFYDLAGDQDRVPELQVRAVYWPANDSAFLDGSVPEPFETIRYSWDQGNSQTWRYAVGLIGRHPMDSVVAFPGTSVLTVAYEDFPGWVAEQTWDVVVFSEFTGESYFTSEGDYSVSYLEDVAFAEYVTGRSEAMPAPDYEPQAGFRMEWAMNYGRRPYLYFSPVDRRLHLLGATGGAWSLDEARTIQYKNLGGGDFLNQWTYVVDGRAEKMLAVLAGWIILDENGSVTLRTYDGAADEFVTLPPADHAGWRSLGAALQHHGAEFASDDLAAMAQMVGNTSSVAGASVRDLRRCEGGFRFVLELDEGFSVSGEDWLGLRGTVPEKVAIRYDGTFHRQPLTAAAIRLSVAPPQAPDDMPAQYADAMLHVAVHNDGLEDAHQVWVALGSAQPGGSLAWTEPQTVTVLAEGSTAVRFRWVPEHPGDWNLEVRARLLEPAPAPPRDIVATQVVAVQPAQQTDLEQELGALGAVEPWHVVLLLVGLAVTGGLAGWVVSSAMSTEASTWTRDGKRRDGESS